MAKCVTSTAVGCADGLNNGRTARRWLERVRFGWQNIYTHRPITLLPLSPHSALYCYALLPVQRCLSLLVPLPRFLCACLPHPRCVFCSRASCRRRWTTPLRFRQHSSYAFCSLTTLYRSSGLSHLPLRRAAFRRMVPRAPSFPISALTRRLLLRLRA